MEFDIIRIMDKRDLDYYIDDLRCPTMRQRKIKPWMLWSM